MVLLKVKGRRHVKKKKQGRDGNRSVGSRGRKVTGKEELETV